MSTQGPLLPSIKGLKSQITILRGPIAYFSGENERRRKT